MSNAVERLPLPRKIAYALGQLGWSLAGYAVSSSLVYYYLPPKGDMGPFVPRGNVVDLIKVNGVAVFGLTVIGLAFALGRLFDAVTDPLIAGLSDRSRMALGKRRSFMAIAVLPFAALSCLVFFNPTPAVSAANVAWLFGSLFLFYWFMTMYVTPYFALLSEIGHTPEERLELSTMISVTWALGTMVGSQVENFQGMLVTGSGLSPEAAFRTVVTLFAGAAFILMLLPILFVDERRYARETVSDESIIESVKGAFSNRDFLAFTLSDLAYWIAITVINSVMIYYVVVLLDLDAGFKGLAVTVMFLLSFAFYVPVTLVARKAGKKRMLALAFTLFAGVFVYAAFLGRYPFAPEAQALVLAVLASFPLAIFSIVQNAIVADIAEADGRMTGNFKAGIFFGTRTFMSKLGQTVAGFLIPSLLIVGTAGGNLAGSANAAGEIATEAAGALGVRATALVAAVFCVIGLLLFLRYDERSILKTLEEK